MMVRYGRHVKYLIFIILLICLTNITRKKYLAKIETNIETDDILLNVTRIKSNLNCKLIIESDVNEIKRAEALLKENKTFLSMVPDSSFIFDAKMCKQFRSIRGYDDSRIPIMSSELEFPLAFGILTYEHVEQFERALKAIYRPHNIYCVHVDKKSPISFHSAIKSIVQCFNNVFIATKLENIVYAGMSRLQADLNCMSDLVDSKYVSIYPNKRQVSWKYYLNLASTELPLHTNYQITRILKLFNGANDIEIIRDPIEKRIKYSYKLEFDHYLKKTIIVKTNKLKSPVPHNYTITKGLAYGEFSYEFVKYVLTNRYAIDLYEWLRDTYSPDETYWATLQYNTHFNPPGSNKGGWGDQRLISTLTRFLIWRGKRSKYNCTKQFYIHNLCIFSLHDLNRIVGRAEIFLNKLKLTYDPVVYECMEEWLYNQTIAKATIRILDYCRHSAVKNLNKFLKC